MLGFINGIVAEIGKPKFSYPSGELDHDMFDKVFAFCEQDVMAALDTDDKNVRDARMVPVKDAIWRSSPGYPDLPAQMEELIYKIQKKKIVRRWLLVDKKRVDGRAMNRIRPLAAEVGVLPRVHGSGLFTRGRDAGADGCHAGHPVRGSDAGRYRQRYHQALYAPLQYARLLHRRGKGCPVARTPRDRSRCAG